MIEIIAKSIRSHFTSNSDLNTLLGGRMYFQKAPQEPVMPYCVFYINNVGKQEIMSTVDDRIDEVDIQFNLYTNADDGGLQIADMAEKLDSAFDWQTVTVTGYSLIKMQRTNIANINAVDDIWQSVIDYELWVQKN
ncbi:MAG: hypothetical protein CMB80_02685 [Flammeovirgaceae bacterium]|nr:hypothetical protein [Flammeovirgaceae bacterium]|tara:strand:- start:156 stop:563 length:408 start_codon:yes stop_codon:yes gene_type:complete